MKQVLFKKGAPFIDDVPSPVVSPNSLLIKVRSSCISAGTELTAMHGTRDSLIKRAIKQPENIIKAANYARQEGFLKTVDMLNAKNNTVEQSGYSIAGIVIGVGKNIHNFVVGDRVAAAGGTAVHAEYVEVPVNLIVKIPNNIDFPLSSTVAIGSIALHAVRRSDANIGEFIAVYGVGLIGQIVIRLLSVSGVRVLAIDINKKNLSLAKKMGAEHVFDANDIHMIRNVNDFTIGRGVDKVVFSANTNNPEALSNAFKIIRKKGCLVMLGVWGNEFNRADIYDKEIDFNISTSYGPGRYDKNYEELGIDYPYHYVRWTENRNMAEYLRLIYAHSLLDNLPIEKYPIKDVQKAFHTLESHDSPLLSILDYGEEVDYTTHHSKINIPSLEKNNHISTKIISGGKIKVGIIGAGAFAEQVHLPNLKKMGKSFEIIAICNKTGISANRGADRFSAIYATSNPDDLFNDHDIDLIMICTRHNLHGDLVMRGLKAGKHIFVEKPLCTKKEELEKVREFFAHSNKTPLLMVGFNRRFSPISTKIKEIVKDRNNPLIINYQMNAGHLPIDHWAYSKEGGGRIVGEACHIIDLFSYIIESSATEINTTVLGGKRDVIGDEDICISIKYEDGSLGILNYFSKGSTNLSKERFEIHFDGKSILVDNYQEAKGYGIELDLSFKKPEKGLYEELEILGNNLLRTPDNWPIELESILETTALTLAIN
jgi:predicted dehydrogenase/threonine dehydrogenase-like Zn-dependent dehydrogenase